MLRGFGGQLQISLRRTISVAWVLAITDYRYSNRSTRLGIAWPTIGLGIRILAITTIFSAAFKQDSGSFALLVTTGLIVWGFLSDVTNSSVQSFSRAKGLLLSMPLPLMALPLRNVFREVLMLGQNFALVAIVLLALNENGNVKYGLFFLGLTLVVPSMVGVAWIVAIVSVRFPDLGKLISSLMQVLFFVTPVIWDSRRFPEGVMSILVQVNPYYHLLNVMRLPLMGETPTLANYLVVLIGGTLSLCVGYWAISRNNNKIMRWLA